MRKHPSIAPHPPAAPTIPAVTIGLDLSDKTAHWCALDQAGNVSGRGQLRLTHAELRKHFTAIPPARIALEASGQPAWIADLLASLGHEALAANPRELKSSPAVRANPTHAMPNNSPASPAWGRFGDGPQIPLSD